DKVRTVIAVRDLKDKEYIENHYIILCTRKGIIKKTRLEDFSRPRQSGINAITINPGDQLLDVCLSDGNHEVMMAVRSGRAIRFPEEKVRPTGRGAIGVNGISVDDEKDEVIGMICVNGESTAHTVLVLSAAGYGKRTPISEYRITNRGGKGVKTINITPKTGELVGLLSVTEDQDLMIICKSGVTIRTSVSSISEQGRATQGVRIINVNDEDEIAAITKIDESENEDENVENGDNATPDDNLSSDNANDDSSAENTQEEDQ
ncbi:MAG TPA: DNA gyrase C-terminal beta-propeller domain-containing protein, partial [Ginsengibacter sp.]|nr:DNA gyrase C-terminal beta-propeller domain-containing protein [Ginsengibacter sp.]